MKNDKGHLIIKTLDMHTGGEPLRIVTEGFPELAGNTILEMRKDMKENYDEYRKYLMWEPRGHADMYGLIKVPAENSDSAFGVLFMHNAGYSTMCGHATIAIGKAAVDNHWVEVKEPVTEFRIDAPCGQLVLYVKVINGKVIDVSFDNVPSFHLGTFKLESGVLGSITYDLAYGGAFYAYLDSSEVGLRCEPGAYSQLISMGRQLKREIATSNPQIKHPYSDDLSFLYGTIFIDRSNDSGVHSRNVCVFADGEVDRCATGSGISGRAAIHYSKGELKKGHKITVESITETTLDVEIVGTQKYGPYEAVIPRITGQAYYTGIHEFMVDSEDPVSPGFLLR